MGCRRSHTKSRNGCDQCKGDRRKCDEQKPSCGRCTTKGELCSFRTTSSSLVIIAAPQSGTSKRFAKSESEPRMAARDPRRTVSERTGVHCNAILAEPQFSGLELHHLRLMKHYALCVCQTINDLTFSTTEGLSLWRDYVPELAFEHDFLLQGLLGLSSLHLAMSQPALKHKHSVLSIRYHDLGVTRFRPHLANITPVTVNALFAFSCIAALYSFGIQCIVQRQLNPLAKIHEVLTLIRGTGIIVGSSGHWLMQGPWSAMLSTRDRGSPQTLSVELESVLAELSQRIDSTIATQVQSDTYVGAIAALRDNLHLATTHSQKTMTLVLFPIAVPPEFLSLVCIGEPLALAILANYAVILHWMRSHIWLEGWGKQVVDAVHQVLPENWRECIAWAVKETKIGIDEI